MSELVKNRYEALMIFDVENGNPNGDPDNANAPRQHLDTGLGYVTDVCLKHKSRSYIETFYADEPGMNILMKPDKSLNSKFTEAYTALDLNKKDKGLSNQEKACKYMLQNYWDVRTYGAVMSTGDNPAGKVRGAVQVSFAKSVDPIDIEEITITRQIQAKEEDMATGNGTMGQKAFVPYGLYVAKVFVSAPMAEKVGLTEDDLEKVWESYMNMFEHDHSAAHGVMTMRKLILFKHETAKGNAPQSKLFDLVKIEKKTEVPSKFEDYEITIDYNRVPEKVELIEKL